MGSSSPGDRTDSFNAMMDAQEDLAAEFDSTAVEIPPGKPQVRFVEDSAQWVPRGRVLRCHIEDDENGETVIYIEDRQFSLTEFGGLLRYFAGWGMRIIHLRARRPGHGAARDRGA